MNRVMAAVRSCQFLDLGQSEQGRFYPRCPKRMDRCLTALPPLIEIDEQHSAACYLYDGKN